MAEAISYLLFRDKRLCALDFFGVVSVVYYSRGSRTSGCESKGVEGFGLLKELSVGGSRARASYCSWQSSQGAPQNTS
jgi:hypothetical protein